MARPEEKAQAMLNKWVSMREEGNDASSSKPSFAKRPFLASQCLHLDDAERYRRQIVREISNAISKIQNPGLGEHAIRDLNDEINKKLREKHHWNKRIKELGGPDFIAIEKKQQLEHGEDNLLLQSGYRYFGAAKDLPGVKELFQKQRQQQMKRKRGDIIYKNIGPDYFGWREEEDGVLLELEKEATKRNESRYQEFQQEKKRLKQGADEQESSDEESEDEEEDEWTASSSTTVVPSQELIAQAILEQKKQALLERFR